MKATLQDIADYAGVSRGTVDRVLHKRPKVSEENHRKVEEALKKFNYTPNPAARSLVLSGRKLSVGVVFPPWSPYYRNEVLRGIGDAKGRLQEYGIEVITKRCASYDSDEMVAVIDSLVRKGIRGLSILAENRPPIRAKIKSLTQNGLPVVTFCSDIPGSGRLCCVSQDETKSGRIAGDLMVKILGRRGRILVVYGGHRFEAQKNRVDGFVACLSERGIPPGSCILATTDGRFGQTSREVARQLDRNRDVAGIYMAYENTAGAVAAVRRAGKAGVIRMICHDVPDDVAEFLREGIIDFAVDQNVYRQGAIPITILADYLLGGKMPESDVAFAPVVIVGAENMP